MPELYLGVTGGANVLLYPPQALRAAQDGRNLFTQQVTHSSLPAAFKLCPKKTASHGAASAKFRVQQHLGIPFSGATEKGQQRQLCDAGGGTQPYPHCSVTAGFAEPPQTPELCQL